MVSIVNTNSKTLSTSKSSTNSETQSKKLSKHVTTISGEKIPFSKVILVASLNNNIVQLIKADYPDITQKDFLTKAELNRYKKKYLERLVKRGSRRISNLQREVIDSLLDEETISENADEEIDRKRTRGEIISDQIADFAGSWTFIILFFVFLFAWMALNSYVLLVKPFDPYPYILLNLALSTLAAIQAPLILMSQNRKEARDRMRAEGDYKINLKSELEIRLLNEKLDHLSKVQWRQLLDLEKAQVDVVEDIQDDVDDLLSRVPKSKRKK